MTKKEILTPTNSYIWIYSADYGDTLRPTAQKFYVGQDANDKLKTVWSWDYNQRRIFKNKKKLLKAIENIYHSYMSPCFYVTSAYGNFRERRDA